jgi:exonuclease III
MSLRLHRRLRQPHQLPGADTTAKIGTKKQALKIKHYKDKEKQNKEKTENKCYRMPISTNYTLYENCRILYQYMMIYFSTIYDILARKARDTLYLYKKTGIFYEPGENTVESPVFSYDTNVRLVSYNIDDLACHRPQYTDDDAVRATEIISYLESTNADIICLQEVWSESMKQEITDAFLAKNFHIALPPWRKNYVFGENSGLITMSKYPIISQTFIPFSNPSSTCRLFNKGVQYCHIRVPNSNPQRSSVLNIANTHLQASFTNYSSYLDFHVTTKEQLNTIINECPFESCLIVGDLNLTRDQLDEFVKNESKIEYFGENKEVTFPDQSVRLDYFLLLTKLSQTSNIENVENKTDSDVELSDHFPIVSDFKFQNTINNENNPLNL